MLKRKSNTGDCKRLGSIEPQSIIKWGTRYSKVDLQCYFVCSIITIRLNMFKF